MPAISVSTMEMRTRITPASGGRAAMSGMPVRLPRMIFAMTVSPSVTRIPMTPAAKPMMSVSALKTREISFRLAPMALRMPISLVRSSTLM